MFLSPLNFSNVISTSSMNPPPSTKTDVTPLVYIMESTVERVVKNDYRVEKDVVSKDREHATDVYIAELKDKFQFCINHKVSFYFYE